MTVYILRHGETRAVKERLYCGVTDIALSEEGKYKLKKAKKRITSVVPKDARYITSGMKRCDETLQILFGDVAFEKNEDLREMDFGAFEMKSYDELKHDPEYQEWISGDNEKKHTPGGESGDEMKKRALHAFFETVRSGKDTVIVTHGGVIAVIMAHLFPDEHKNRYEWQCAPGEGYALNIEDDTHYTYRAV